MAVSSLDVVLEHYRALGVTEVYVKQLAPNDNSKNQVYFGGDYSAIKILPIGEMTTDTSAKREQLKAKVNFHWLTDSGETAHAPGSQLILYPQYPEVRFSGFLQYCKQSPGEVMRVRDEGRLLFLGIHPDDRIIGYACFADSPVARDFKPAAYHQMGVFSRIPIINDTESQLITDLRTIIGKGWIESKRLNGGGEIVACTSSNCGGYTLEAELGIIPNGLAEPDYLGWELKQHSKKMNIITLMTPEPTGGIYKDDGIEHFIRTYGYPDKKGRPDRLNFGGVHRYGSETASTHLTLHLDGYNSVKKTMQPSGGIVLVDRNDNVAAKWHFESILRHWNRKHNQVAYIPSEMEKPPQQYRFGPNVHLATGTDPGKFLAAIESQSIYYDPGIKLENISSDKPKSKRRSQFRIKFAHLQELYENWKEVDLS